MKTFSKMLIAAALAGSFAAPVYANTDALAQTLAERDLYANSQGANGWTAAYAMNSKATWAASRAQMSTWQAPINSVDRNVSPASLDAGLKQVR